MPPTSRKSCMWAPAYQGVLRALHPFAPELHHSGADSPALALLLSSLLDVQLDPAVAIPVGVRVVREQRAVRADTTCREALACDAALHQRRDDRVGAALRDA